LSNQALRDEYFRVADRLFAPAATEAPHA
jgi:hypothetical protein